MSAQATYRVRCKGCDWQAELPPGASDRCPRCSKKLQLAPKESLSIMREAVKNACDKPVPSAPQVIARMLNDKDAPKDEGMWEFQLRDGVLTIIAWNDDKSEAQCVRLVRRGAQIHLMHKQESEE